MIFIPIAVILLAVILVSCFGKPSGNDPVSDSEQNGSSQETQGENEEKPRCEMFQFRYNETGPEGEFSIFMEQSYNRVRYVVHDTDGESRQYYVDSQVLFDIYDLILEENMADWKYIDSDDVEAEGDTVIKVEYRVGGMTKEFGTRRMPVGGLDLLHRFVDIAASYESDDTETKPFTVRIGGKTYSTVRGTGNSVGTGAVIDFGDDKWWIVEGFVGSYKLTDRAKETYSKDFPDSRIWNSEAVLEIKADGSVELQVDNDQHFSTAVDSERLYGCYASAMGGEISFAFRYDDEKGEYDNILEFKMRGWPYPEDFAGYDLYLEKID